MINFIQQFSRLFQETIDCMGDHSHGITDCHFGKKVIKYTGLPLYTVVNYFKPRFILEIGSCHYSSSNMMGRALEDNGIEGVVVSLDIMRGGYNGQYKDPHRLVKPHYWMPVHDDYDGWKYSQPVEYPDFRNKTNDEIFQWNCHELELIMKDLYIDSFDLVFIDGDHSKEGVEHDWEVSNLFSHPKTIFAIDDIWDNNHRSVRNFWDSLPDPKYDFSDWAASHGKVISFGLI